MSEKDETFHDYKVTQEVSKKIITFPMTSLFCWRQHFLVVTSALFTWKYVSRWKSHNFLTIYRREVVDPSFCCYKIGLYKKWCLTPPSSNNFADVSTFSAHFCIFWLKYAKITSRDVTWRHHFRFWPNFQEIFSYLISYLCPNLK